MSSVKFDLVPSASRSNEPTSLLKRKAINSGDPSIPEDKSGIGAAAGMSSNSNNTDDFKVIMQLA